MCLPLNTAEGTSHYSKKDFPRPSGRGWHTDDEDTMKGTGTLFTRGGSLAAALAVALTAVSAVAADPSWLDKDLLAKAKANNENTLTIYASMNEREGLPLWKEFTEVTGIKTEYVRASDTKLMARITVEKRAGKESWDLIQTTSLKKMPDQWLAQAEYQISELE